MHFCPKVGMGTLYAVTLKKHPITGCGENGREGSSLFSGAGAGLRGNAGTCTASTQRAMPEREKKIDTQKAIHADV